MSDGELIQDVKLRRIRQMDSMTETQVRPPKPSRMTRLGLTYASQTLRRSNTYPKVWTFGRRKLAPLASGTMTMGCGQGIHLNQTLPVREPAAALVPSISWQSYLQWMCTDIWWTTSARKTMTAIGKLDIH